MISQIISKRLAGSAFLEWDKLLPSAPAVGLITCLSPEAARLRAVSPILKYACDAKWTRVN